MRPEQRRLELQLRAEREGSGLGIEVPVLAGGLAGEEVGKAALPVERGCDVPVVQGEELLVHWRARCVPCDRCRHGAILAGIMQSSRGNRHGGRGLRVEPGEVGVGQPG